MRMVENALTVITCCVACCFASRRVFYKFNFYFPYVLVLPLQGSKLEGACAGVPPEKKDRDPTFDQEEDDQ